MISESRGDPGWLWPHPSPWSHGWSRRSMTGQTGATEVHPHLQTRGIPRTLWFSLHCHLTTIWSELSMVEHIRVPTVLLYFRVDDRPEVLRTPTYHFISPLIEERGGVIQSNNDPPTLQSRMVGWDNRTPIIVSCQTKVVCLSSWWTFILKMDLSLSNPEVKQTTVVSLDV